MKQCRFWEFEILQVSVLSLLAALYSSKTWASACCARSSAAPSLILGEDQAQVNFSSALGFVVAKADEQGAALFKAPNTSDILQAFRMDGAVLLSDRLQVGGSLSLLQHSVENLYSSDATWGMGDTRLSLGYEFMPLWNYSKWKPQGYLFSVLTLPTGRSVYDMQSSVGADVMGNGFYSLSVGTIFLKRWSQWDFFVMPEVHYSLPRVFKNAGREMEVVPGFGGSLGLGGGFSPGEGNLRLGIRIQPRIDQPRAILGIQAGLTDNLPTANCDFGFDASYLIGSTDTVLVSYTDQTLLGPAMNSNLSRNIGLNFQHRWER